MALLTKRRRRDVEWNIHFHTKHFCGEIYTFNVVKYSRSEPYLVEG